MGYDAVQNRPRPKRENSPNQPAEDRTKDLSGRLSDVHEAGGHDLNENGVPVAEGCSQAELHEAAKVHFPADIEEKIRERVKKKRLS